MPGRDRTGPTGAGPLTGRGFGPCGGNTPGRGFGGRFGGRFGAGGSAGWRGGRGRRGSYGAAFGAGEAGPPLFWGPGGGPGYGRGRAGFGGPPPAEAMPFEPPAAGGDARLATLERRAAALGRALERLQNRIASLRPQAGTPAADDAEEQES